MSVSGDILVTGGAGYIGSHVVRRLVDRGGKAIVVDNISNGCGEVVEGAILHEVDICDWGALQGIFQRYQIVAVMHFAASTIVSDSVASPGAYYRNNAGGTANLLECAVAHRVRHFVFSSSAAVYGVPEEGVCQEDSSTEPISPYGKSKLFCEQMLRDVCAASDMRYVALRYFNVAGADAGGQLGQRGHRSTHIFKIACEVATGTRASLEIYGTDYATADGTCIRDYVHVEDLAAAHCAALRYLSGGGVSTTLNCGYGRGFSVREVIQAVERAAGRSLPVSEASRRAGDPPVLVAASDRIRRTLDWSPKCDDLDYIARTALAWERSLRLANSSDSPPGR